MKDWCDFEMFTFEKKTNWRKCAESWPLKLVQWFPTAALGKKCALKKKQVLLVVDVESHPKKGHELFQSNFFTSLPLINHVIKCCVFNVSFTLCNYCKFNSITVNFDKTQHGIYTSFLLLVALGLKKDCEPLV